MGPKPKPKDLLGKYGVPIMALELQEAFTWLEDAELALERIDPMLIVDADREFGRAMLSSQLSLIRSWKRTVRQKLQTYLAK